jgi:hypothetical protein
VGDVAAVVASNSPNASSNQVIINSTAQVQINMDVFGVRLLEEGVAEDNTISITGTSPIAVSGDVYGVYIGAPAETATNSQANRNTITVTGNPAAISGSGGLIGALVAGTGNGQQTTGNTVTLQNITVATAVTSNVVGAMINSNGTGQVANSNVVTLDHINGANITQSVRGAEIIGTGGSKSATLNRVNINSINGTLTLQSVITGAIVSNGEAISNQVNVTNSPITLTDSTDGISGAIVTTGDATRNEVILSNSNITVAGTNGISGAVVGTGAATQNRVTITDGNITGNVYGGLVATSGDATDNSVTLTGVTTGTTGTIIGGVTQSGKATGNVVTINGGNLNISVIGGSAAAAGDATGNFVNLRGAITNATTVQLQGGSVVASQDGFTGNTLTVEMATFTNSFQQISGFQNFAFTLDGTQNLADPTYSAIKTATLNYSDGGTNFSQVSAFTIEGGDFLDIGDTVVLVSATTFADSPTAQDLVGFHGLLNRYDVQVTKSGTNLVARVTGYQENPQASALNQVTMAHLAFINYGTDRIADDLIPQAILSSNGVSGITPFFSLYYGKDRIATGSRVEARGLTGDIGVAVGNQVDEISFAVGAFLEFGKGEYQTYQEFAQVPTVHSEGDVNYLGGGLLTRIDFGTLEDSRAYFEASFRLGRAGSDYFTRDLLVSQGRRVDFDLNTNYMGLHFGLGYIANLNDLGSSLDLSAKYLLTQRNGGDVVVVGDRVTFGDIKSQRLRAGARVKFAINDSIYPYLGGYFEHEFAGDSDVTIRDRKVAVSSFGGSTGIGELGLNFVSPDIPIQVDVGLKGSGGQRDSITGGLNINYTF